MVVSVLTGSVGDGAREPRLQRRFLILRATQQRSGKHFSPLFTICEAMPDKPVVLITGSEGLIGDALVRAFSREYHTVGFDIARPQKRPEELDFIDCDLTKDESVDAALEEMARRDGRQIASVIHLAAYYDFSGDPGPLYRDLTVEGTRRLLRGLQRFEVEQFVFSSTHIPLKPSEEGEPVSETSPKDPAWAYPKSKLLTERLIQRERPNPGGDPAHRGCVQRGRPHCSHRPAD
jgi:nucleoside-diphosphate-sugar epimerase